MLLNFLLLELELVLHQNSRLLEGYNLNQLDIHCRPPLPNCLSLSQLGNLKWYQILGLQEIIRFNLSLIY